MAWNYNNWGKTKSEIISFIIHTITWCMNNTHSPYLNSIWETRQRMVVRSISEKKGERWTKTVSKTWFIWRHVWERKCFDHLKGHNLKCFFFYLLTITWNFFLMICNNKTNFYVHIKEYFHLYWNKWLFVQNHQKCMLAISLLF